MVTELRTAITTEEILRKEHSSFSSARKTIQGPTYVASDATDPRSVDPVQAALASASAPLALEFKKAYRVIASEPAYFRLSKGAETAVVGDIYLPANQAIVIETGILWDTLSAIKAGTTDGIIQAVEVK